MVDVLINCDFLVIKTRYATIVTVGRDDNNGYQHSDEWNVLSGNDRSGLN